MLQQVTARTRSVLLLCELAIMPVQASGLDLNATGRTLRAIAQIQAVRDGKPSSCCWGHADDVGDVLANGFGLGFGVAGVEQDAFDAFFGEHFE